MASVVPEPPPQRIQPMLIVMVVVFPEPLPLEPLVLPLPLFPESANAGLEVKQITSAALFKENIITGESGVL